MPDSFQHIPDPSQPSFLKRWLGWRIIALTAVVLIVLAPVLYRGSRLARVPVIDEPFDVEEYLTRIPEKENSYFDFEQAIRELREVPRKDYDLYNDQLETGWDFDTTVLDNHLENNRLALNTWCAATQKNHYHPPAQWRTNESPDIAVQATREFSRLSRTCVQKLGRLNQPEEAIPWIKAQLRFAHLIRQKGPAMNYAVGVAYFSEAARTANEWSSHPALSREDIDHVREDLKLACDLNPRLSEVVKAECIADASLYKRWTVALDQYVHDTIGVGEARLGSSWRAWLEAEPEYTVRLCPHIARNHLLFIEADRRDRPPVINGDLFEDATATPAQPGELRADELAKLIQASYVLPETNLDGPLRFIDRDEARYRCLTVALAAQAYFRDHSEFPEKAVELVPEYLKEIPDDLFSPTPAPLLYRRDGDGAVVYSRFTNEIDDGGTEVNYDERRGRGDLLDLGYRIRNPHNRP